MAGTSTINGLDVSELLKLAEIADQLGADHVANEVRELSRRVAEGRFYLACVGQFKRGKSTLLDALVGQEVLPTGVVPVTSVPTVIRYGTHKAARVQTSHEWVSIPIESLSSYVSEEHNPENAKGIEGVEVFLPVPLLQDGMCLVDTPGIGSVFSGNTAATQAFVPHVDAALVVLGADPPISGDELSLVQDVATQVKDFVVVLNKADRTTDEERRAAASFTCRTLREKTGVAVDRIYEVSALERLNGQVAARDWGALLDTLEVLSTKSGRTMVHAAMVRGNQRLRALLLAIVCEQRVALLRPIEDSEARLSTLQKIITDAEQSLVDLGYLLTGVQHRVSVTMAQRREAFLKSTHAVAAEELATRVSSAGKQFGPAYRHWVLDTADDVARQFIMPWLRTEQAFAADAYQKTTRRFIDLANEFLKRVSEEGAIAGSCEALEYEQGLNVPSEFRFEDFISIRRPASPFRYMADASLSVFGYLNPIHNAGYEFLDRLLETNSSRIQHDLEERLIGSRRKLERQIREVLRGAISVSERSVERARTVQERGQRAVQDEIQELDSLRSALQ